MPRIEKKHTKDSKDREVLSLYKELKLCYEHIRQTRKTEPINPPERHGYEKTLVVREDLAKSEDNSLYQKCLSIVNNTVVDLKDNKFEYYNYKTKKYEVKHVTPNSLTPKKWEAIQESLTARQKDLFVERYILHTSYVGIYYIHVWEFTRPWAFVEVIKPHYEYYRVIEDEKLLARVDELYKIVYHDTIMCRKLGHLLGWGKNSRDWIYSKVFLKEKEGRKDFQNQIRAHMLGENNEDD